MLKRTCSVSCSITPKFQNTALYFRHEFSYIYEFEGVKIGVENEVSDFNSSVRISSKMG